jgi:hypothetical protein
MYSRIPPIAVRVSQRRFQATQCPFTQPIEKALRPSQWFPTIRLQCLFLARQESKFFSRRYFELQK